jgi:hypothetical protein
LKFKAEGSCSPSPEEDKAYKAFDEAFDEAVAVSELNDKRKVKEDEIKRLESYVPKTPRESLEKAKSLKAARQGLKNLTEPKRLNQRHRIKVRKIAKGMWQKHLDWTIHKMIESNEVNAATTPRVYKEKTLRNWIKDLSPNRLPGRRPQKV